VLPQATTTPLVRNIFELFFKNQIDDKAAGPARRKRCGICEVHIYSACPEVSYFIFT